MVATSCFGSLSTLLYIEILSDYVQTLPWNSAGHTLFLFFVSFRRSKSALCHLVWEATCSLGTHKQLHNVTSVVEYSKIVTAQQLGDRIMHIIHIFYDANFKPKLFTANVECNGTVLKEP